jgi:hypothetical protein
MENEPFNQYPLVVSAICNAATGAWREGRALAAV